MQKQFIRTGTTNKNRLSWYRR